MSKLKHTPGPWIYQNEKWNTGKKPDDAEYCVVSESPNARASNVCNILDTFNPESDARLIAAAPEMLEALIDAYCNMDSGNFKEIEAVVEKATGMNITKVLEMLNEN